MIGGGHSTTIAFADCVVTTTSVIFTDHQGAPNPGGRIAPDGLGRPFSDISRSSPTLFPSKSAAQSHRIQPILLVLGVQDLRGLRSLIWSHLLPRTR